MLPRLSSSRCGQRGLIRAPHRLTFRAFRSDSPPPRFRRGLFPVLESILQKFRGIVLALMIVSLSLVFVLQFGGPQAEGCSKRTGALYAAEVYGEKVSLNAYRAAFALSGGDNYPPEMVKQYKLDEMVLHGLVERILLARE